MPTRSKAPVEDEPVEEPVPEPEPAAVVVTQPEPVGRHHARFTVRQIAAASASGLGYIVFDTQEQRMVDAPFRDREDAVARASKREIRG